MKVILLKDIKGTGKKGDLINASDGHARNFLIPRGLAKVATDGNVSQLKHQQESHDKRKAEELDEAKALAAKIEAITIKFKVKSGDGGKLFGSITTKDIASELSKNHKIKIDKKKFVLENPIKTVGSIKVKVKVYPSVTAKLSVDIDSL